MNRWMKRNRWWLVALLPLLIAAIAVTGWRQLRILPLVEYTHPQTGGSTVRFHQVFEGTPGMSKREEAPRSYTRDVTISALGATTVPSYGGNTAASGATLQLVTLRFEADPSVPLRGCEIVIVDAAGTEYSGRAGKVAPPEHIGDDKTALDRNDCVPEATPGPDFDWETGELTPGAAARPASWTISTAFALPTGVQPTRVIVRWPNTYPDYALLDLPR